MGKIRKKKKECKGKARGGAVLEFGQLTRSNNLELWRVLESIASTYTLPWLVAAKPPFILAKNNIEEVKLQRLKQKLGFFFFCCLFLQVLFIHKLIDQQMEKYEKELADREATN